MILAKYLKKTYTTYQMFAEQMGVTRWAVQKWVDGERLPSPRMILQIQRATEGAVTLEDFVTHTDAVRAARGLGGLDDGNQDSEANVRERTSVRARALREMRAKMFAD